jgi:hypothetical protein
VVVFRKILCFFGWRFHGFIDVIEIIDDKNNMVAGATICKYCRKQLSGFYTNRDFYEIPIKVGMEIDYDR